MQPDLYTKAVLTVIAVALCALAIQTGIRPARAAADCGDHKFSPCYVEIVGQPVLVVGR